MKICNDVVYIFVRQRIARPDLLVIRLSKIRPTRNDDAPQALVADLCEVAGICDLLMLLLMAR
jgi:hypothetical protein